MPGGEGLGEIRGLLIVLSGPSGVGKGTILERASQRLPNLCHSISATTRPPRPTEEEGRNYFFRSPEQFEQMRQSGEFLEWARYLDYCYGTPRARVLERLREGRDVTLEIDVQGGKQVCAQFPDAVLIFVLPPSEEALRDRLLARNTESEEALDRRLRAHREECKHLADYDYAIINDRLEDAVELFCCIVRAEKARVRRLVRNE